MTAAMIPMLTVASTLVSAGGSILQGVQANKMAKYQAKVAEMNKSIAEDNARRAIERSQVEQQESDMTALAFMGSQEAMQGASGLSLGGASQQLARKSSKELARLDALRIRQGGELEAYNYRTQGVNFGAEASMAKAGGKNSLVSGFIDAGSSLLTGAGRVAKQNKFGTLLT